MSRLEDSFFFVIYPKTIVLKGIHNDQKLPHYSVGIFKGDFREDYITVVPTCKQQLHQTLYVLQKGKLQFSQTMNMHECQQRRFIIYQKDKEIGDFILRIDQYMSNYQDYNSKYYEQIVKLNNNLDFEFEIFMGNTINELSDLLIQYRGESDIKTPITISSRDKEFQSIRQLREVQSQIFSPTLSVPKSQTKQQIDQESSLNSQNVATPDPKKSFMINLNPVPSQSVHSQAVRSTYQRDFLMQQFRQFLSLPLKDKLIFSAFALLSLVSIYISMLPIKKI